MIGQGGNEGTETFNNVANKISGHRSGTFEDYPVPGIYLNNVNGYEIAGKTGTAEQAIDGQYSKTKINTFASVFPSAPITLLVGDSKDPTNPLYASNAFCSLNTVLSQVLSP